MGRSLASDELVRYQGYLLKNIRDKFEFLLTVLSPTWTVLLHGLYLNMAHDKVHQSDDLIDTPSQIKIGSSTKTWVN